MKNNLLSILAYAENGDNEKIIRFVNEIREEGGIKTSTVTNSGKYCYRFIDWVFGMLRQRKWE